jgi:hypothetical protein
MDAYEFNISNYKNIDSYGHGKKNYFLWSSYYFSSIFTHTQKKLRNKAAQFSNTYRHIKLEDPKLNKVPVVSVPPW